MRKISITSVLAPLDYAEAVAAGLGLSVMGMYGLLRLTHRDYSSSDEALEALSGAPAPSIMGVGIPIEFFENATFVTKAQEVVGTSEGYLRLYQVSCTAHEVACLKRVDEIVAFEPFGAYDSLQQSLDCDMSASDCSLLGG